MHKLNRVLLSLLVFSLPFFKLIAGPDKPNVLFILADDLGWGDPQCYGGNGIPTPGIDRLAREGVRFTQFYQGGSVCSPTRATLMTAALNSMIWKGIPLKIIMWHLRTLR